jgi:hypothetical protein
VGWAFLGGRCWERSEEAEPNAFKFGAFTGNGWNIAGPSARSRSHRAAMGRLAAVAMCAVV